MFFPNISIASRANSASGRACGPLAVVIVTSESSSPARSANRPTPALVAWIQRRWGREESSEASVAGPKSKRISAPSSSSSHRSLAPSSSTEGSGWADG